MNQMNATSSSSQASVVAALDDDVLMALPKRKTVARSLQRARQNAATAAAGGTAMPPVPSDLHFALCFAITYILFYVLLTDKCALYELCEQHAITISVLSLLRRKGSP